MKTYLKSLSSKTILAGSVAVLALAAFSVWLAPVDAVGQGQRGQGKGFQGGQGDLRGSGRGGSATTIEGRIFRGKGERVIIILEDEDSDRPAWAGGNPALNPNAGAGEGNPDAGTIKGDEYGDLIVLLRDPITGEPVVVSGEYLVCLDAACTSTTPTVDLEVPDGVTPIEVDFGRAAIARAPDAVIDKALADALTKLTQPLVELSTDTAGRIVYTYPVDQNGDGSYDDDGDGVYDTVVTGTIDSPLENLALYIDLMNGLASSATSATEGVLGSLATLDSAASLFAGVADKTGDITLDYFYYQNLITDVVVAPDTYYDLDGFTYTRTDFPDDYSYFYQQPDGTVVTKTLDVESYLTAINGDLPAAGEFAALFATAADDALEVIELVHTQIHTEILPGTVNP